MPCKRTRAGQRKSREPASQLAQQLTEQVSPPSPVKVKTEVLPEQPQTESGGTAMYIGKPSRTPCEFMHRLSRRHHLRCALRAIGAHIGTGTCDTFAIENMGAEALAVANCCLRDARHAHRQASIAGLPQESNANPATSCFSDETLVLLSCASRALQAAIPMELPLSLQIWSDVVEAERRISRLEELAQAQKVFSRCAECNSQHEMEEMVQGVLQPLDLKDVPAAAVNILANAGFALRCGCLISHLSERQDFTAALLRVADVCGLPPHLRACRFGPQAGSQGSSRADSPPRSKCGPLLWVPECSDLPASFAPKQHQAPLVDKELSGMFDQHATFRFTAAEPDVVLRWLVGPQAGLKKALTKNDGSTTPPASAQDLHHTVLSQSRSRFYGSSGAVFGLISAHITQSGSPPFAQLAANADKVESGPPEDDAAYVVAVVEVAPR